MIGVVFCTQEYFTYMMATNIMVGKQGSKIRSRTEWNGIFIAQTFKAVQICNSKKYATL